MLREHEQTNNGMGGGGLVRFEPLQNLTLDFQIATRLVTLQ